MNKRFKQVRLRTLLFLLSLSAMLAIGLIGLPAFSTHKSFPISSLSIETYDFFDLGIADINADNRLDIFTSNHSALQSVALNQKNGEFVNALTQLGLDQDSQFPALEDSLQKPALEEAGLYIYRYQKGLYIQSYDLTGAVTGTIKVSWPLQVNTQHLAEAKITTALPASDATKSTVEYTLQPGGLLVITGKDNIVELPHSLSFDTAFPLAQVFIGLERTHPQSHQIELTWRDRHSFAWADVNQDQKLDAFVVRGGVKGELEQVADTINDELMLMGETRFENEIERFDFQKRSCPGRQAAWVDFDADNRLDLYIGCGRAQQPTHHNQLYQQQENGKFIDVAARLGLDFPEDGPFRWLDFDNDADSDLLIVRDNAIWLYIQDPQKPETERFEGVMVQEKTAAKLMNLLISDFDADGDSDVYVESKQADDSNWLLVNEGDRYKAVAPDSLGLPNTGVGGSWVDYDNSGAVDFYIAPYGLYRHEANHRFERAKLLDNRWKTALVVEARSAWFDMDNDGDRDLVTITKQAPTLPVRLINKLPKVDLANHWKKLWVTALYRNRAADNHWLEIELSGDSGNAQAIGARVTITVAGQQHMQTVGSTESAYFSQGHYRLYFGLGKQTQVDAVEIMWPDGQQQAISRLEADRLWQLSKKAKPVPIT